MSSVNKELCNLSFTATEADSDDGIPHTLEHLVFLGSEDYPYKGVLDLLANRCLANGTSKLITNKTPVIVLKSQFVALRCLDRD